MTWLRRLFQKRPDLDLPLVGPRLYPTAGLAAAAGIDHGLRLQRHREVAGIVVRCGECESSHSFRYRLVAVGGFGRVTYDIPGNAVAHFHTHPDARDARHSRADRRVVERLDPYRRPSFVGNGDRYFLYTAVPRESGAYRFEEDEITDRIALARGERDETAAPDDRLGSSEPSPEEADG